MEFSVSRDRSQQKVGTDCKAVCALKLRNIIVLAFATLPRSRGLFIIPEQLNASN